MMRTLEIAGAPSVRLNENHAATRERESIMTCVTSDVEATSPLGNLPLEVLFKAKTDRRTLSMVLPAGANVSVRWAVKGSYREEHLLA